MQSGFDQIRSLEDARASAAPGQRPEATRERTACRRAIAEWIQWSRSGRTRRSVRQFASAALTSGHAAFLQNPDLHLALARSEFRLGLLYFASKSFERSKLELEFAPDTGEARLLSALTATLLTVRPKPSPDSPRGSCLGFDTSALRNFLNRSISEPKDVIALAGAALARLALECPHDDFVQNAHTLLDQAQAGGAFYVGACWYDQMLDARPFSVGRLFDCGDPRSYRCLTIPWQGR